MKLKIYTDGSCKGNGTENSRGGWAYICLDENEQIIGSGSGGINDNTTNNRMELIAALKGIKCAEEIATKIRIIYCEIYTDSAYLHNCIKQKWYVNWQSNGWLTSKKTEVLNKDLWEQLIPYFDDSRFEFFKVKGHTSKQDWNDKVDKMAQKAADSYIVEEEEIYNG